MLALLWLAIMISIDIDIDGLLGSCLGRKLEIRDRQVSAQPFRPAKCRDHVGLVGAAQESAEAAAAGTISDYGADPTLP
jgi:hypothetical protein